MKKARVEYHNACKTERSYINQERNAAGDSTISPDTVRQTRLTDGQFVFQLNKRLLLAVLCCSFLCFIILIV